MPGLKEPPALTVYERLVQAQQSGTGVAMCTVIRSRGSTPRSAGSKMLVYADGRTLGSVGGGELESRVVDAALAALRDGEPRRLTHRTAGSNRKIQDPESGSMEVFVEPVLPPATVVVVGGGHVGKAVVQLAAWLGFRVVLSDDRTEFCAPENVPGAHEYLPVRLSALPERLAIHSQTYLLLITRNVEVDVEGLPALLDTAAAFIGIIGSKQRWATTRQQLLDAGIQSEKLDSVVSPLGLELNAETPEEIAVSILAEIIMLRRGGDGSRMGA
jgi:xanthine dehydrogenase accessory factor